MKTRSPIKDKPLRHPGQSLEEERRAIFEDKIEPQLLLALFFILLAALEWWRFLAKIGFTPLVFTAAAVGVAGFAGWRCWRLFPKMRDLRQAIEGEKAVGQYLERLRESGYQVFHDIIGVGFNIDHVLIGRAGVFTIETKTWSKPLSGDARITFNGERLLAAGHEPDRNPLRQARAQATWLRTLLMESTGKNLPVFPVVLFPGWYVERSVAITDLWVLEPKALPPFLANEPVRLAPEDVNLARYHLSRYIRSLEREKVDQSL